MNMGIWWLTFFTNLLYSVVMIIGGWFMWKKTPKDINHAVGYRTSRSMKNEETWKFAHEDCGKRWWIWGWIMLVPTLVVQLLFIGRSEDAIGNMTLVISLVECSILVLSIIPTEMRLKKTFDDDGRRIND